MKLKEYFISYGGIVVLMYTMIIACLSFFIITIFAK